MPFAVINPFFQFFDNVGEPLDGGTVETYESGTSTPKVTYQDATLTTPNTTTITLNSAGRCSMFVGDGETFKYILKDSSGVTIETKDGVKSPYGTQAGIGELLYPRTAAETAAGVTPSDYAYRDVPASPERYGYTGANLADDTLALQRWASVAAPRELLDKTYQCNDRLTFPKHASVIGKGSGVSIIDFSGATGTFTGSQAVSFSEGELVALPATSGDPAEGGTQITFASAHGLAIGDIFLLHDDTSSSWSGFHANYTKGEMCVVAEVVSSTVVGLLEPLYDSYTSSSTNAFQLDYGTVHMEGVGIKGVSTDSAIIPLLISHTAHARLRDVKVTKSGLTAVTIRYSYDVQGDGLIAYQYFEGTEVGTQQYGVSIIHCQDVRLNGQFQGERHAITTGATSGDGGIVNRGIIVSGNLKSLIDCAADFHGNTEHSAYDSCVIHGAVALGGNKNACRNSTIIGNSAIKSGKVIAFREMKGFDFNLSNLECRTLGDPHATGGQGVIDIGGNDSTTFTANTTLGGRLRLNNINVDAPNANAGIVIFNRGSTAVCSVLIDGVHLEIDTTTDVAFGLVRIDALSGDNIQNYSARGLTGTDGLKRSKNNFDVDNIIEEHETAGSFTPTISFGGGVTGQTYSHQIGRYELNGNVVTWSVNILFSAKGSSTGNAVIQNLPFTVLNVTNYNPPAVVQGSAMTFADQLSGIHITNSATVALQEVTNAGSLSSITDADFTNTTLIRASGQYIRAY